MVSASLHAVYLAFKHEEEDHVAVFTPGKMFINGSENLLTIVKAENILKVLLNHKTEFNICVKKLSAPFTTMIQVASSETEIKLESGDSGEKRRRDRQEAKESKTVSWGISLLYAGIKPELSGLKDLKYDYGEHEAGWQTVAERVCNNLMKAGDQSEEENGCEKIQSVNWFIASMNGYDPSNIPTKYPENLKTKVKGTIKEVHRPFGGVVDVGARNGGKIAFHRNVVSRNGMVLRLTEKLENVLSVGQTVTVDIVNNKDDEEAVLLHDAGDKIASAIHVGPHSSVDDHPEAGSYGEACHRVRVAQLYQDDTGMVTHGLGCIQYSQFIKNGMASGSMVGEFVTFKREDLFFFGVRLSEKVDLSNILNVRDEIKCHLKMLDTKQGRAQFVCKIGWIDNFYANQQLR